MNRLVKLSSVIIGAGMFLTACSATPAPQGTPEATQPPSSSAPQSMKGTLQSLLGSSSSQQCTFSDTSNNTKVNGTMYIANGKMKGDITTVTEKKTTTMHMVVESPTMYMWSDDSTQGMKFMMPSSTPGASPAVETNKTAPNLNQTYTYSCSNWNEDDSVFVRPEKVSFMELGGTSPSTMPTTTKKTTTGTDQCAVCNNIPAGEGRTACLTQLNCK